MIKVPRFSAYQYNLTFKWLLATLYDKTHFQSGKEAVKLIYTTSNGFTYEVTVNQVQQFKIFKKYAKIIIHFKPL